MSCVYVHKKDQIYEEKRGDGGCERLAVALQLLAFYGEYHVACCSK